MLVRLMRLFALASVLVGCASPHATSAPALPTALPRPAAQPSAQPLAAAPGARATSAPAPPPTAAPTAIPTAPPGATINSATPTAIPAATATPATKATAAVDGRHVFPVQSDGKISYGRFHHDYAAADIFCPIGSVFVAVTDGMVDFVSREDTWDPKVDDGATRGGLAVAIVGDDGVRYYGSHLSRVAGGIAPGVRVSAGQQLALTGRSGDARFTDPHLHFGISHPTTPDDWAVRRGEIPPYDYLQAWQRGENVTPDLTR